MQVSPGKKVNILHTRDVVIMGGQSNESGQATTAGAGLTGLPDSRILITYKNDLQDSDWASLDTRPSGTFGPEILLGQTLANAGWNPALIKFSWGSTLLADDANPQLTWNAAHAGGLTDQWITYIQAKLASLGQPYRIRAIHWCQGESDGMVSADATAWGANFVALQSYVNAALGQSIPWCWVLTSSSTNVSFITQLRASQAGAQVNNDGFPLNPDNIHLGPAAQIHSGTASGNYILSLPP